MTNTATDYYNATASNYDALRENEPEHILALDIGWPLLGSPKSVLDVGCGTGRGLDWLGQKYPELKLSGIEPSDQMLGIAKMKLPGADLSKGLGEHLPFADGAFDVAIATGVMHHADNPSLVISEMFRVARRAVLISDHNNYAFGGPLAKRIRIGLKIAGMLRTVNYFRQNFSHRGYSEDDGWWYPYSLFDNYAEISQRSSRLYIFPTRPATGNGNLLFSQSHIAIVGIK